MVDYLKKLYTHDKDNFQVTGFIVLVVLGLTYFFKSYLLGIVLGPKEVTPEDLVALEKGGFYQQYVSFQTTDYIETDQMLITQTTQKGRVIDEDYEGQFILVPVDQSHYMAVNVASLPDNKEATYTGFLFDDLQYSLPYWADNMDLKGDVLPFYLDNAKQPAWWVLLVWAAAVIFCVVAVKELLERHPDRKKH